MLAYPNGFDMTEYNEMVKCVLAEQEKGEPLIQRPDVKGLGFRGKSNLYLEWCLVS
jgi:hypothetical protein